MMLRPAILSLLLAVCCFDAAAQSANPILVSPVASKVAQPAANPANPESNPSTAEISEKGGADESAKPEAGSTTTNQFRLERMPLAGGAELLTIFGRLDGLRTQGMSAPEVPLVSVVRDTLSDTNPENDRLRYVWMLTHARPGLMKRVAAAVPFLYTHVRNQTRASSEPPKPIIDLANTRRHTWNEFFWTGLQSVLLDSYGIPLKASTRTYRQNINDYRSGHIMQALSILDNYERLRLRSRSEGELLALRNAPEDSAGSSTSNDTTQPLLPEFAPAFTPGEMLEIRARLILSGKIFGGLLGPDTFHNTVAKRTMSSIDYSGHNWEILRQRAEAEGLYFEPLKMPDGTATHAMLWIAKSDLATHSDREFHKRFLNIANPWNDEKLRSWKGYSRVVYFDQENRPVGVGERNARAIEMIPLAVYGLDHPKIPALLIDFRHSLNPKKREMSRRLFNDLARNIFSLSSFGNLPYLVGNRVYDFMTGRRGMDLNQPTRLRSYSQLKLLLSFNSSIDSKLRTEIEQRVQNVSLNPLNNDDESEALLARQQYDSLVDYARRPEGLSAKIERDRRLEMVPLRHGRTARVFFTLGNIFSFGRYVHREKATPELYERLELARRVSYHTRFLNEVAKSSPQTDIAWDLSSVKQSLQFLAYDGSAAGGSASKAAAAIFEKTSDDETRRLSLEALSTMNNKTARKELLRLYEKTSQSEWRTDIAGRLRQAIVDNPEVKPAEAKSLLSKLGQP
jgi:hypothetical protein